MNLRGRARVALRWARTTDETRPRLLAIGAATAGIAVVASVIAAAATPGASLATPGPLSSPHAKAGLACASCHEAAPAPKNAGVSAPIDARIRTGTASCTGCHGEHALRGGHTRAAAQGTLTCATCHPSHGGETVSFSEAGRVVHSAGNSRIESEGASFRNGTNVPVLRTERCTGCHDLRRAADPLRPCVDSTGVVVRCFGEHDRTGTSPRVCDKQHDGARFAARDAAARVVGGTTSPALAAPSSLAAWLGLGPVAAGLIAFTGARLARRRRKAPAPSLGAASTKEPIPRAAGVRRLPVIDVSRCLGCYACVDACAFDVLDVERYVAKVARPDACCSATSCEEACPNGSLVMRDEGVVGTGSVDPLTILRRQLSHSMELDSAPGVFLVGDLTGVPLIKNAIVQGRTAIDAIAARYPNAKRAARRGEHDAKADVLIIGAGPAGLAASLRAEERGLSYVTLEQSTVAASIKSFPRGKLVFDAPIDLPLEGEIALRECTKEELVGHWNRIVRTRSPRILEQHRVVSLERDAAHFVVSYERVDGSRASLRARAVVVAIGQRGTPRRLEATIAPGAESMVADALFDARSFAGKHVIIVGLGDAALEAAQALAHQPGTSITLVHRGNDFTRGRAKNVTEVKSLIQANRIRLKLKSTVTHVDRGRVFLQTNDVREELDADVVLALLGGIPSASLLSGLASSV